MEPEELQKYFPEFEQCEPYCRFQGCSHIREPDCGVREAVENGKTGFLCEVKNTESLYQAMKKVLNLSSEKREAMGMAGRKKMVEEFEKGKVVRKTISELERGFLCN